MRSWVDACRIGGVVHELGSDIALDVVRVVISVAKLYINPELVAGVCAHDILGVVQKRRRADTPFVTGEQHYVGA